MLESVMIIRLATGAMVEVVVPFGFSKAGFLSGCPVELGVVAASKEGTEDAEFHAGVGADGGYTHGAPELAEEDAVGVDLAGLPHLATYGIYGTRPYYNFTSIILVTRLTQ